MDCKKEFIVMQVQGMFSLASNKMDNIYTIEKVNVIHFLKRQ